MNNIFWQLIYLLYFIFAGRSILQRPDWRGTNHLLTNSSIWRFCSRILRQMFFFHWKLDFTTDSWRSQSQWPQEQVNIIYFHEFFVLITIWWNFHEFFSFFFSREEKMKDVGMASTFNVMLNHSNEAFYDVAMKKVCIQII